MKFSELGENDWAELAPYLDTALLPVTGLLGEETPPEAAALVGAVGDWLAPIESAFRGRTVTYPANHYIGPGDEQALNALCARVRSGGFRHIVVISGRFGWDEGQLPEADLLAAPRTESDAPDTESLRRQIADMWKSAAAARG